MTSRFRTGYWIRLAIGLCVPIGLVVWLIVMLVERPEFVLFSPPFFLALFILLAVAFYWHSPPWRDLYRLTLDGRHIHGVNIVTGRSLIVDLDRVKRAGQYRQWGPRRWSAGYLIFKLALDDEEEFEISQDIYENYQALTTAILVQLRRRAEPMRSAHS